MGKRPLYEEEKEEELNKKKLKIAPNNQMNDSDIEDGTDNELSSIPSSSSGSSSSGSSSSGSSSSGSSSSGLSSSGLSDTTTLPSTPLPSFERFVPIDHELTGGNLYVSPPSTINSNHTAPDSAESNSSNDSLEGLNFNALILHEPVASISGRSIDFSHLDA